MPMQENVSKTEDVTTKYNFIKIVIPLISLLIFGTLIFLYKDKFLQILNIKEDPLKNVEQVDISEESPFSSYVEDPSNDGQLDFLAMYDEYGMDDQGIIFEFVEYKEESITLKRTTKDEGGEILSEETYSYDLPSDFLILCTNFDITKMYLDTSRFSDEDKYIVAKQSYDVPLVRRLELVREYPVGSGLGVVFSEDLDFNNLDDLKIKKLLLILSDPLECYR